MLEDRAEKIVPVVLELEKYTLVCFDPQTKKAHLRRTDEGELLPENQVGFEEHRASRTMKMAQVLGEEDLVKFLKAEVGVESAIVESALQELRSEGQADIPDLVLSDGDPIVLGLRYSGSIWLRERSALARMR
jgi:hypothetical protein